MTKFDFYNKIREDLFIQQATFRRLNSDLIDDIQSKIIDFFIEKKITLNGVGYDLYKVKVDILRELDPSIQKYINIEICFMSDDSLKLDKKSILIKQKAKDDFYKKNCYLYSSNRSIPIWKLYSFRYEISELKDFEFLEIKNATFI